jgi:hypothetical protein
LITIEQKAQLVAYKLRESEPEGLDAFSIRSENYKMALIQIQVTDLYALFVGADNGSLLVDPHG